MKEIIDRVPLPLSGVALSLASLGNLLDNEVLHILCGSISVTLVLLLILKLMLSPESIRGDLKTPILASVSGTFPMTLMLLSTYISNTIYEFALALWAFAILLHIALMIYFTKTFIIGLDMEKVFASYFIVYVGIVVASCTCPFYDMLILGEIIFWFGFLALVPLFVLISYRYVKYRKFPEPTFPLLCIYCAPVSLCIVGYVKSMTQISEPFIMAMYIASTLLYMLGLCVVAKTLTLKFYPSYAAITFPMVICAMATTVVSKVLQEFEFLNTLAMVETVIASIIVFYVLIRFVMAIATPSKG